MNKKDYWDATFDDTMDLIGPLPRIAAYIYRRKYKNNDHIQPDGLLDWSGNLAHMMGYEDESFKELMRLYMTIHADHEGGNVSRPYYPPGRFCTGRCLPKFCSRYEWPCRSFTRTCQPGSD